MKESLQAMNKKYAALFTLTFIATLSTLIWDYLYFLRNAEQYARSHMQPQVGTFVLYLHIAAILAFIIYLVTSKKRDRGTLEGKLWKVWYSIPALIVIFGGLVLLTIRACNCGSLVI